MTQQIAGNSQHTGGRRNRGYAESWTREQLDGLLSEDWLKKMVADIRGGDEKLKDKLPFICPHYSAFQNNHRAQKDIIPEAFTFMTCVDVDDLKLVKKAIKSTKAVIADEMSDWQELVLRMDYSARKKLHIWLRLPIGKTIGETQEAFCKEIDIPYDESCVTPERYIYLTGIEEEIYRSPNWLEAIPEAELEERREAFLMRGLDVDGRKLAKSLTPDPSPLRATLLPSGGRKGEGSENTDSKPADDRTMYIFRECMKEEGVSERDLVDEGGRHNSVKMVLSQCNQLLTQDETLGVLKDMMPEHWDDDNIKDLVKAYYTDYYNKNQRLTAFQKKVFRESKRLALAAGDQTSDDNAQNQDTPPEMPEKKPKLIELITSRTPDIYKAAVAHAAFPSLATHLCGVRFTYTDNVEHEATLMNCLMAGTGAGKGCIDEPIRHIMADIKHRDEENERREAEWKKDCQKKGANKDKLVRPEGLVIQMIDPDMTKPALVTRMDEAEGHFVYVKLNELDLFEQLKGQTGKQHFQLMCLAFDPGAEYGQTRIGTQSVTARPVCRFNWNACTTILKGRKFFSRVLTDGPISRINFCTIPETEIGAEQPVYGAYDVAFDEALKPYIDNLVSARGLIDCPQAYKLAKKLQQECAEFARLSQSEVYWNLSHRACVIAWLKACVLYVANGQKWETSIEDFIRWSLNYDMWCKMQFFGADIEKAVNGESDRTGTHGPRNLLELLPDNFTVHDAIRVRQQQGLDKAKVGNMISTWKKRSYVVQMADGSYQKSDRFRK